MKKVLIGIGIAIVLLFGTVALTTTPLAGEVVTLHTVGADGEWETTPLWVVDEGGYAYLRAGAADAGWVLRLQANPQARLERGGEIVPVRAILDESARDRVNQRMAEAYGWAEAFLGMIGGDSSVSLPLRLEVVEGDEIGSSRKPER